MKIVEIDGQDYNMPEGWHEVTVEKFYKFTAHADKMKEYKSDTLFSLEMYSILLDAPADVIKKLTQESYVILTDELSWISKDVKPSEKIQFNIEDNVYVPIREFQKMTMGEMIDIELMIADSDKNELMINLLPILVRKAEPKFKGSKTKLVPSEYDSSKYFELKELFKKNLMITDVISFNDFFLTTAK